MSDHAAKVDIERLPKFLRRFISFKSEFDKQVELEIMRTERVRARVIGVFTFVLAVAALLLKLADPPWLPGPYKSGGFIAAIFGLFAFSAYEVLFGLGMSYFIKRGLKFPVPPRFINAFVEISIPSVVITVLTTVWAPAVVLNLPPILLYFLIIALSILRLDPALVIFSGFAAAAEYGTLGLIFLPSIPPGGMDPLLVDPWFYTFKCGFLVGMGGVGAFVAYQVRKRLVNFFKAQDERNRIASIFGQHVSPAVMEKLVNQQDNAATEVRQVCVLFLDIRNFTTFSESRRPEEVVAFLNKLFDFMIDAVNTHKGMINKFLGDGFMAVFGAPLADGEACANAIAASVAILERLNVEVASGAIPPTRIGIGMHVGDAVTGNVGSAQRQEYTIIGDVVNLASRIESLNKQFEAQILLSEEVWKQASVHVSKSLSQSGYATQELGPVSVKGRAEQVRVIKLA